MDDLIKFFGTILSDIFILVLISVIACANTTADIIKKIIVIILGLSLIIAGAIYIFFL